MHYLLSFNNFKGKNKRLLGVLYLLSQLRICHLYETLSHLLQQQQRAIKGGGEQRNRSQRSKESKRPDEWLGAGGELLQLKQP